eukprot:Em0019g681a
MRAYYAILGVGSIGFSSLQAIATFSMLNQYISPTLIPMNVSQIDGLLVGTIVAPSSGLLLIVLMAILVIILFRFYKAKRMKRESITDHYTTKTATIKIGFVHSLASCFRAYI